MNFRKTLKRKDCSLTRFKTEDEKTADLLKDLFTENEIAEFLNQEYLKNRTKPKIRRWMKEKADHPYEKWYVIKWKTRHVGYICFKWRKHYDEACEISTAIHKDYRGLKLGFHSSKLLIDYILDLKKFKYIVGYVFLTNKKAENNLRKLGFRMNNRLHKIITKEFYGSDGSDKEDRKYNLMVIYGNKFKPSLPFGECLKTKIFTTKTPRH